MPGALTVDTVNETLTLQFTDDKGDTDAAAPAGLDAPVFTSDNPAVATIAPDPANPLVGDVTVVGEGSANLGIDPLTAGGSPLTEADGTTPFPQPATVAVTVTAGAAVGDALVLNA